jgi:thiamine-phosphate pyrophosphorylase
MLYIKSLELTLVTQKADTTLNTYLSFLAECLQAGVSAIQLREKTLSFEHLLEFGQHVKALTEQFSVPLIINDHLEICQLLDADGLHLGQTDRDVLTARQILGPNKMIGVSVNTLHQVNIANDLPVDYLGVGPVFPTRNKTNQAVWELTGLERAVQQAKHPIIAIGGIDLTNAAQVFATGINGMAAIGVFHDTSDYVTATQRLRTIMENEDV